MSDRAGPEIYHPNREAVTSRVTRATVVGLLLLSVLLMAVLVAGSWNDLTSMRFIELLFLPIYLALAYSVMCWRRGALPISAAFAVVLAILAAIAAPSWFDQGRSGFSEPTLGTETVGLITTLLVPLQVLLIAFALRGFHQEWHVEAETE